MPNWMRNLIILGVVILAGVIVCGFMVDVESIEGNQLGVMETWEGGPQDEPLNPKTYFLFPSWRYRIFRYDMGLRVFVMNDRAMSEEGGALGREKDSYLVQSKDQQDMKISTSTQFRLDPAKIVYVHKRIRGSIANNPKKCMDVIAETILRPVLLRVIKDEATLLKATDAYAGEGLVKLQANIHKALTRAGSELADRGVIVENFVIEGITLDNKYVEEIRARQIAVQREQRAVQEEKAAIAEAAKAKAEAQKEYEQAIVKAKQEKEVGVMNAEMKAEQEVKAAEAAAKQVTIAAKAKQQASEAEAAAILAKGKAESEAKRMMLSAYAVQGADAFVQIEVSKSVADAFRNIDGYLPERMTINLLSDTFMDAVKGVMSGTKPNRVPVPKQ